MAIKAEIFSKNGVLQFYNNQDGANWEIWRKANIKKDDYRFEKYDDDDKEEGAVKLLNALSDIDINNSEVYAIIVDNGKNSASRIFKVNNEVSKFISGINQTSTDPALLALLDKQQQQLNELPSRFNADDNDDDDDEKESGIMGLINHELYGPMIATAISGIVSKFLPAPAPTALAGIPDEQNEKINQAIAILKNYDINLGDHLLKLADIAQNNNAQFNMLLKML
jgi:glucan phosphorylase